MKDVTVQQKFKVNGREYSNIEEIPAEFRKFFEDKNKSSMRLGISQKSTHLNNPAVRIRLTPETKEKMRQILSIAALITVTAIFIAYFA